MHDTIYENIYVYQTLGFQVSIKIVSFLISLNELQAGDTSSTKWSCLRGDPRDLSDANTMDLSYDEL